MTTLRSFLPPPQTRRSPAACVVTTITMLWAGLRRATRPHRRVTNTAAGLFVVMLLLGTGCARRFKLTDTDLAEAEQLNALPSLRVYPSHRTISVYDEAALRTVTVEREIRQSSRRERPRKILRRSTPGAVIGEDLLNGERILWVTFNRQCATPECAYGFVRVKDRYLLVHVPELEGYSPPQVYRSIAIKRHRLKKGHLRSLAEANQVYRLERKRRVPVVFLEVKRANQDRVNDRPEWESGV